MPVFEVLKYISEKCIGSLNYSAAYIHFQYAHNASSTEYFEPRDDLGERIEKEFKDNAETISQDSKELAEVYFEDIFSKTMTYVLGQLNDVVSYVDSGTSEFHEGLTDLINRLDRCIMEVQRAESILPDSIKAIAPHHETYSNAIRDLKLIKGCIILRRDYSDDFETLGEPYFNIAKASLQEDFETASAIMKGQPEQSQEKIKEVVAKIY